MRFRLQEWMADSEVSEQVGVEVAQVQSAYGGLRELSRSV